MTVKEAKEVLSGKLVFGDEKQIKARKFLEQVEEAKEVIRTDDRIALEQFSDDVVTAAYRGMRKT